MAFPWGIALVGGVAVVGGIAYLRAKQQASSSSSACDAICTAAAAQGVPVDACKDGAAYQACKAASGLFDTIAGWISGPDWAAMDADNKKLNGDVELALGPLGDRTVELITRMGAMHGTVLRFKNGGVPFRGFPGWEKCAKGTHDMLSGGAMLTLDPRTGKWTNTIPANAFTGGPGDPTTAGPFSADHHTTLPAVNGSFGLSAPLDIDELSFPQPLEAGAQGFYDAGVPFTCPAGQSPQWDLHDHRTSAGPPPCVGADGSGGWVSSGPSITGTFGQSTGGSSWNGDDCSQLPKGYTWVDATPTKAGHWERLRSGQVANPPPKCRATAGNLDTGNDLGTLLAG